MPKKIKKRSQQQVEISVLCLEPAKQRFPILKAFIIIRPFRAERERALYNTTTLFVHVWMHNYVHVFIDASTCYIPRSVTLLHKKPHTQKDTLGAHAGLFHLLINFLTAFLSVSLTNENISTATSNHVYRV